LLKSLLDKRVEKELDALAQDVRQRFLRIVELIETYGLPAVNEPEVARTRAEEVK